MRRCRANLAFSHGELSPEQVNRSRSFGLIIIAASAYWLAIILAMHFLEPQFSPMRVPMSAYVLGAYGAWMTTSFFALAVALLAAASGLAMALPRALLKWIAFSLLIIAAGGVVLGGLFPSGLTASFKVAPLRLHALGSRLAFPTMAVAPMLFSVTFVRDEKWRNIATPALGLSTALIVVFLFARFSALGLGLSGLMQRLFFVLLVPWLMLVGLHMIRDRAERN